jgi:hypothetical protein
VTRDRFIVCDGERIPVEVVRSDRRTLALVVARDGRVTVRAPRRIPEAAIEGLLEGREAWVAGKRAEAIARSEAHARLTLGPAELAAARRLFAERLDACWPLFARPGEAKPQLRVRVMRTRWGSLSPSGRICLNATLLHAPRACLDYVIFHELAHLRARGHGPRFYAELARYVPDWRERRRELHAFPAGD